VQGNALIPSGSHFAGGGLRPLSLRGALATRQSDPSRCLSRIAASQALLAMLGGRPPDGIKCASMAKFEPASKRKPPTMSTITIGLDIAKNVFQLHAEDTNRKVLWRKRLRRDALVKFLIGHPPALIGIEACGSAHYWGRTLRALGHDVRLLPAHYVKPFVKRNKSDAHDAAAICDAMNSPSMRFVAVKSVEQQCARALEGTRAGLVQQRTAHMNTVRGLLAEFGVIAAAGLKGFNVLKQQIAADDAVIPADLLFCLKPLLTQIASLTDSIETLEERIVARAKADPTMRLLMKIPGIGPLTAHAIIAAIGDGKQFTSARDFAAWLGLTPRQMASGEKSRSGKISRQGDRALRCLFVLGAASVLRQAKAKPQKATAWLSGIMTRRPTRVIVVAQAAKTARIAWAILTSGEVYRAPGQARPAQTQASVAVAA
jgi:transposase